MKCFYHPEADAVAVCKNCGRGVCPGCAADAGPAIACRDKCETEIRAMNEYWQRNKTAHLKTSAAYLKYAIFYALCGGVLIHFGWRVPLGDTSTFIISIGVICLIGAWFSFWTSRRIKRTDN